MIYHQVNYFDLFCIFVIFIQYWWILLVAHISAKLCSLGKNKSMHLSETWSNNLGIKLFLNNNIMFFHYDYNIMMLEWVW